MDIEIIKKLIEYSISLFLMGLWVRYSIQKEKQLNATLKDNEKVHKSEIAKKDSELKELNDQIRVDNKDSISTLLKLELVLDKVIDSHKSASKDLVISLRESTIELKTHITTKIKEIGND